MDVFSLDPIWASACTGMYTDPAGKTTLALFDPPIALTTAALLLPTPTARPTIADPTTEAKQTAPSAKPAKPASIPNDPVAPPARTGDPGKAGPTNPKAPVPPVPLPGEDPPVQRQGLGAIIYGAFGKSEPGADGSSLISRRLQSIITIGTQIFTAHPTGFTVNNVAVTPGGSPYAVDNTIISLGQSGVLLIGSSTVSLLDQVSSTIFAVAGQTFTPNPSTFSIAGTTISAGGPAVTVEGTVISLGQSGELAIGSSTINIPPPSYTLGEVYTVAGQMFTPNPSAFSIAGTTILADGPAATIDGTIISLGPSGNLVIGSSTTPLSTSPVSPDVNINGFDVQAHSSFVVVDGVTLNVAASSVAVVSGTVVSLEAGGATLDIGTGRFALPTPTGTTNGSINAQAFTGGQSKGLDRSLSLICGVCATLVLLI